MAPKIISFEKILQERLQEYTEIFPLHTENGDEGYPESVSERILGRQVKDFWRTYLSVTLYPKGWKAVWKVPAEKCRLMSVEYPCEILVEVLETMLDNFSALVKVLSIEEGPVPHTQRNAALIELYPVDDRSEVFDAWILANELDKFRFFFQQVWFPWDETDDSVNWPDTHLKERLNLLYDMTTGEMRFEDAERIRYLVSTARSIQAEIERTEVIIDEHEAAANDGNTSCSEGSCSGDERRIKEVNILTSQLHEMGIPDVVDDSESKPDDNEEFFVVHMIDLQMKMEYIQHEVELLSNHSHRTAMAKEKQRRYGQFMMMNSSDSQGKNNLHGFETAPKDVIAIWGKGDICELKTFLYLIESRHKKNRKCDIEVFPQLQMAQDLLQCINKIFVISPGFHRLKSSEQILAPGTVVEGVSSELKSVKTTIFGQSMGKVMMVVDWSKLEPLPKHLNPVAKLEMLCFDPHGSEAVILVDCGTLSVNNCSFIHEDIQYSPIIGNVSNPSTNVLETYQRLDLNCGTLETPPGSMFSMPQLPITAGFGIPPYRGIAVGAGGKLTAINCCFEGLHLGIIAYSKAKVYLSNCRFNKCRTAIRISKGAKVVAENCIFEHSGAFSVHVLVGSPGEQQKPVKEVMGGEEELVGSSILLERIPGLQFIECEFVSDKGGSDILLSGFDERHDTSENENLSSSGDLLLSDGVEDGLDESIIILSP